MRSKVSTATLLAGLLLLASQAVAQDEVRHEFNVQGTGLFTKDSQGNGITQHSTNTGGLLVGYRYHLTRWLAADASYGYGRNTQQNLTSVGSFDVQSNIHQATGAFVLTFPRPVAKIQPFALAGVGALVFDPTLNAGSFVSGAGRQSRPAFVYGGGLDYKLTNHIFLRTEYRGLVYNRPDFGLSSLNSDVTTHTAQPSAGLVFRF